MNQTVLALDLGGTKLLIGEVNGQGEILSQKQYATGRITQQEEVVLLQKSLKDFLGTTKLQNTPKKMGIGMIGMVDHKNGIWNMIDQTRKIPTEVSKVMEQEFHIDCKIENDVKAAALAEQYFGSGKDCRDFIYINVGTGIAAGFVCDGKLLRGHQNDSGEVGHMTVNYQSETPCFCGRFGCVEAIASGYGMDQRIRLLKNRYPQSPLIALSETGFVRAEEIFRLSDDGDILAQKIFNDAADAISEMILNLVRVTNPELVVLGGGVMRDGKMLKAVLERIQLEVMQSVCKGVKLSELDPATIGLKGAAAVALSEI